MKKDPIQLSESQFYITWVQAEKKDLTGFAHLFEHMMFRESQHVGSDPNRFGEKIEEIGGGRTALHLMMGVVISKSFQTMLLKIGTGGCPQNSLNGLIKKVGRNDRDLRP